MPLPAIPRRLQRIATSLVAVIAVVVTASPGMAATAPQPLPQQWWFDMWGVHNKLWAHSKGKGVVVAVLDTGVEADLPELAGAVLPGADFENGGGDGRTDKDQFGKGHGTSMATKIASRGGATGYVGIAPEAQILPVVTQSTQAYVKGIRFAADRGAKVINLSQALAGECPAELQEAVRYAIERDAVIVAGAGNTGDQANESMHPANCKGVLAVGGIDRSANPWEKTQRHSYVDVASPAVDLGSVYRDGRFYPGTGGTSGATALISGIVALVRSKYPQMKNREVVQKLIASVKDVGPPGKDEATGHGVPRPNRIFTGQLPQNTGNPVFEEYDAWAKDAPPPKKDGSDGEQAEEASGLGRAFEELQGVIVFGALGLFVISAVIYSRMRRRRLAAAGVGRPGMPMPPGGAAPGATPGAGMPTAPGQMPGAPPAGGPFVHPQGGGQHPGVPPQQPSYQPPYQGPGYGPPPSMGGGSAPPPQGDAPTPPSGPYQEPSPPQQ